MAERKPSWHTPLTILLWLIVGSIVVPFALMLLYMLYYQITVYGRI